MPNPFLEACSDVVDALTDAGVAWVTLEPMAAPPMVFVGMAERREFAGGARGGYTCTIPVWIVGAPPGNLDARTWIDEQAAIVQDALYPADADPDVYRGPAGVEWPAVRVDHHTTVANPYC